MERSITASALNGKEVLLIKSYLGLLPGKTVETWVYRDAGPADVEIVSADTAAQSRASVQILYGQNSGDLELAAPIRVAQVIAVLNKASSLLRQLSPVAVVQAPVAAPLRSEVLAPVGSSLAELLRAHARQPRVVVSDGDTLIEIDFQGQQYGSSRPLTSAHASNAGWAIADVRQFDCAIRGPLTYLQWLAGVAEARVAPGHYRLNRWPDFGRLPHRPSFLRLAAYFSRAGGSPSAAADAALVPFPDVEAFLGGCVMAGYATLVDEDGHEAAGASHPLKADAGLIGLLSKVRRRLGI